MRKNTIIQRLNIIKGQIDGLTHLIEQRESCRKVTGQFYAINSGLKKVMGVYFEKNLNSCFQSIKLKKRKTIEFLVKEIIKNK